MPHLSRSIHEFDLELLRFLNPQDHTIWIPVFQALSDTTSILAYGLPMLILVVGLLRQRRVLIYKAITLILIVLVADYSALALKNIFHRRRAYDVYDGISKWSDGGNFSFPSGHTTQAAAMAAGLFLLFPEWRYRSIVLVWAALVGFSRVYLGVHYPSDVIGAALLSFLIALLLRAISNRFFKS